MVFDTQLTPPYNSSIMHYAEIIVCTICGDEVMTPA